MRAPRTPHCISLLCLALPLWLGNPTLVAAVPSHCSQPEPVLEPGLPPIAEGSTPSDAPSPPAATASTSEPAPAPPKPAPVKIGGSWFLSYQGLDANPSAFLIKRGYINIETKVLPYMSARITPDVTLDAVGDLKVRLKYAYARFHAPDLGFVTRPEVDVGVANMPWLDFEQRINLYRMQDSMFMERNGLFNSADLGVTFMGLLGGTLPEDYQKKVSRHYPGRWGSFAVGVYNGGGYNAAEKNDNKALEGRLSLRPFPDFLPGLQLSGFAVHAKGNTAAAPDWKVAALMASFQSPQIILTAQWVTGDGNQKGTAVSPAGRALPRDGWSVFAEGRLSPRWSLIGRWETFDPDTNTPVDENQRVITGVAYHLGQGNTVLVDLDRVSYQNPARASMTRLQVTLQVTY